MRIRHLDLERFGHFTDRTFDFGEGSDGADFHIIYGPNEAGKTTTMEAALRLFYGYPTRETYDFKHARSNLQVSAMLDIDGALRRFTRLPKRTASLVDEAGTALPEAALASHLAGLSEQDYRRLLCLDDETIERGGEEIANAQGDIGRLLFSAAAGVADLSTVLDGVRDQADALWKKRGRTTRMADLKRDLADVEKQIRERDVTASAWKGLKKDLIKAQEAEHAARSSRDALNKARAVLEGQRRALPLMAQIADLEAAIAPYATYPAHLDFDPERLIELRSEQGIATQTLERLAADIASFRQQRAAITLDPALEGLPIALDALEDLSARDRGAQLDLDRRQAEQREAEEAMRQAAKDLGVTSPDADPRRFVLSAADITSLEQARDRVRTATGQEATVAREVSDLRLRIQAASDALSDVPGAVEGSARIADVLLRYDADQLAPDHAAAAQTIASARLKAGRSLAALTLGGAAFDTLPHCPTSLFQATDWAERHGDLLVELRSTIAKRDEHLSDLQARRAQAEALARGASIISDSEAEALLEAREARWSDHLAALDSETAAIFHEAMKDHDIATSVRLGHARELGELRQLGQAEAEARARADQAEQRIEAQQRDRTELESVVSAAAVQVGLLPETTPAEWLDWVVRHEAATEDARALREAEQTNQPVLQRAEALLADLAAHLPFEPADLASALNAARRAAEQDRQQAVTRTKAEDTLRQLQRELSRREEQLSEAQAAVADTRDDWTACVLSLLGSAPSADRLLASLEPLRDLRDHETARAAAERRVATMQADQELFAKEVGALARTHGVGPLPSAAQTYGALKTLSQQSRIDRETLRKLDQDIATAETETAETEARQRSIAQKVAAIAALFPNSAPLDDIDALRQVAAQAQQVIDHRAALAQHQRTILAELGVDSLDAARDQLAGLSPAALEAALESDQSDRDHAEERLTTAIKLHAEAEIALSQVKGDGEIAALVEQKATLELQLEDTALEYLELSLAHSLASEAIRRYRDSHRSGMMTATESCFASLTRGAYPSLITQIDKDAEVLLAVDRHGASKRAAEMSKGTRFQLYLALRAAAHEQLVAQGTVLPFFCDDIFETFDEDRTSAACRVMETIGQRGQAIYLTHHRHVVDIAMRVCDRKPVLHEI